MQPTFNPWLGYFDLIDQVETFVLYDDVQLARRSWQTRNRIKTAQGELFITIPVQKSKHRDDLLIVDTKINNAEKWQVKHLKSIQQAYKKAPYFDEVFSFVDSHYSKNWEYLADFNSSFIKNVSSKIGLSSNFVFSSNLEGIVGDKDTRLAAICKALKIDKYVSPQGSAEYIEKESQGGMLEAEGIDVYYHKYEHPQYQQLHGGFTPYYGILDLLFNSGFETALKIIREGRQDSVPSKVYRKEYLKISNA